MRMPWEYPDMTEDRKTEDQRKTEETAFSEFSHLFRSVRFSRSLYVDEFEDSPILHAYTAYCADLINGWYAMASSHRQQLIDSHWDKQYGRKSFPRHIRILQRFRGSLHNNGIESGGFLFVYRICDHIKANPVLAKKFEIFCNIVTTAKREGEPGLAARLVLKEAVGRVMVTMQANETDDGVAGHAAEELRQSVVTSGMYSVKAIEMYLNKAMGTFSDERNVTQRFPVFEIEMMIQEAIKPVFEFVKWFVINVALPIGAFTDDNHDDEAMLGQRLQKRSFCYWLYEARREFQTRAFQVAAREALVYGPNNEALFDAASFSQLLKARPA